MLSLSRKTRNNHRRANTLHKPAQYIKVHQCERSVYLHPGLWQCLCWDRLHPVRGLGARLWIILNIKALTSKNMTPITSIWLLICSTKKQFAVSVEWCFRKPICSGCKVNPPLFKWETMMMMIANYLVCNFRSYWEDTNGCVICSDSSVTCFKDSIKIKDILRRRPF